MSKNMVKVTADLRDLAAVIEEAMKPFPRSDVTPNYQLAAHAFLEYMDSEMTLNRVPDKFAAAGHLYFALHGMKPVDGANVPDLMRELDASYRPEITACGEAAWEYFREQVRAGQKVSVQ